MPIWLVPKGSVSGGVSVCGFDHLALLITAMPPRRILIHHQIVR